ncbi:MAG: putative transposase [Lysobacterales bacterium]|jgi:putative transposase
MARKPRINLKGVPQHVVQRGNNKQACFYSDQDYRIYLEKLHEYGIEHKVKIHSYVLMTNHVHLLMTPDFESGISKVMQSVGRYYVRYINQTYHRTGTLWEGRFKSTPIDSERYFLVVSRYIELNPIRAGMLDHPADYLWSSYRANALGKQISLLTPHECYLSLGHSSEERQAAYSALFKTNISDSTLKQIRDAVNSHVLVLKNTDKKQLKLTEITTCYGCNCGYFLDLNIFSAI